MKNSIGLNKCQKCGDLLRNTFRAGDCPTCSGPKHTPGPWSFEFVASPYNVNLPNDAIPETDDCYVKDSRGFHIAKIYSPENQFVQHGETDNAALIAAAPEMLEALEQAKVRLKNAGLNDTTLDIVKAAIAKAKGGA